MKMEQTYYDWTNNKKRCEGIYREAANFVFQMLDIETDFESHSYLNQESFFVFFNDFFSSQDTIDFSQ